jgi:hypothetical protein
VSYSQVWYLSNDPRYFGRAKELPGVKEMFTRGGEQFGIGLC